MSKGIEMNESVVKTCSACNSVKSVDEFSRKSASKDGLASSCKACNKAYWHDWYWHGNGKAYMEKYNKSPVSRECNKKWHESKHGRACVQEWESSDKGRRTRREYERDSYKRTPEKKKSRNAVYRAVRRGELPSLGTCTCLKCGSPAESRHHYLGYDEKNWFDVIELCDRCHQMVENKGERYDHRE